MDKETEERLTASVRENVRELVLTKLYGPVVAELINAATDIAYLSDRTLDEAERPLVRKIARRVIREVLVQEISKLA